jgi:ankyrin repeat protein
MAALRTSAFFLFLVGCAGAVLPGCPEPSTQGDSVPAIDLSSLPVKQQIIEAAISGNLGRVEALVTSDASLANVCNADSKTPLHFAAAHGHNAIVTYLLENGADPLAVDSDGNRPQATAIDWGHLDTAKILGEFSPVGP